MVAKWDSQQALKPPAFDQDDHVTSVDGQLDIAVTCRGGRLNMGWKKVTVAKLSGRCASKMLLRPSKLARLLVYTRLLGRAN